MEKDKKIFEEIISSTNPFDVKIWQDLKDPSLETKHAVRRALEITHEREILIKRLRAQIFQVLMTLDVSISETKNKTTRHVKANIYRNLQAIERRLSKKHKIFNTNFEISDTKNYILRANRLDLLDLVSETKEYEDNGIVSHILSRIVEEVYSEIEDLHMHNKAFNFNLLSSEVMHHLFNQPINELILDLNASNESGAWVTKKDVSHLKDEEVSKLEENLNLENFISLLQLYGNNELKLAFKINTFDRAFLEDIEFLISLKALVHRTRVVSSNLEVLDFLYKKNPFLKYGYIYEPGKIKGIISLLRHNFKDFRHLKKLLERNILAHYSLEPSERNLRLIDILEGGGTIQIQNIRADIFSKISALNLPNIVKEVLKQKLFESYYGSLINLIKQYSDRDIGLDFLNIKDAEEIEEITKIFANNDNVTKSFIVDKVFTKAEEK